MLRHIGGRVKDERSISEKSFEDEAVVCVTKHYDRDSREIS